MDRRVDGQTDITGKRGEEKEAMWVPERPLLGPAAGGVSAGHGQQTAQCGLGMPTTPPQAPFSGFCASS